MARITMYLKGKRIEKLEDIKKYFQVYELMDYMNYGALRQWLEDNGYKEYSEKLSIWSSTDQKQKKKKLYDVFGIEYDDATEYTLVDELLLEKRKDKEILNSQIKGECVRSQKDLELLLQNIVKKRDKGDSEFESSGRFGHTNVTKVIKLMSITDYDIPINIPDIRYVGVTASEEFPTVNLEVDEKEYNQQGIFFENVYVKIKMSEKVDQGLRKNGCPYETR